MKTLTRIGMVAFAAVVGMASTQAYAGCVMAGGESPSWSRKTLLGSWQVQP